MTWSACRGVLGGAVSAWTLALSSALRAELMTAIVARDTRLKTTAGSSGEIIGY